MKKEYNYNYALLFYDVGEKRVNKVFKICKRYLKPHQKSVFRGHITPANLIALKNDLCRVIKKNEDFISIFKLLNEHCFEEESLGKANNNESIFI